MGDKHLPLTITEVEAVNIRYEVADQLDRICQEGRPCGEIRVLDFGCGRGATVLKLLQMGFDAYGVDIDPDPIRKGEAVFESSGFLAKERLLHAQKELPFEKNFFDIVVSDQVMEHIEDLELVTKEISRVMTAGGVGIHYFPAKWKRIEPHVFVPFVHWLPKNHLRYWLLKRYESCLPLWYGHDEFTIEKKLETFYIYLNKKTYYRTNFLIEKIFKSANINVKYCGTQRDNIYHIKYLVNFLDSWINRTFRQVTIISRKK